MFESCRGHQVRLQVSAIRAVLPISYPSLTVGADGASSKMGAVSTAAEIGDGTAWLAWSWLERGAHLRADTGVHRRGRLRKQRFHRPGFGISQDLIGPR